MADHKHGHDADDGKSESAAYETRDVKVRPLAVFIAGLTIVGVFVYLVSYMLIGLFGGQAAREDAQVAPSSVSRPALAPGEERLPPEPRLQAAPAADMGALRREEDAILTTYGWVDRQAGVVRIPIDVAMQQVLEEGFPVRQPDSAPPSAGTPAPGGLTTPQERVLKTHAETPQGEMKKAEK
jgi:hypothetical protein